MRQINDFSDERYKGYCLHCAEPLGKKPASRDHVPSKALLDRPLPTNVHVVDTCLQCNNGFSSDEEYFAAFLGAVMSGSAEPNDKMFATARKILASNENLRHQIELSRSVSLDSDGTERLIWHPEIERIRRVVTKNARGHAFYELGQPMLAEPDAVFISALETIDENHLAEFLTVDLGPGLPEVGSRMLQRVFDGSDIIDGWIVVQPEIYVFAVIEKGGVSVRSIIREYLLTEVVWQK
jgi:hypothetical protein